MNVFRRAGDALYEADRKSRSRRIRFFSAACGIFLLFVVAVCGNIVYIDLSGLDTRYKKFLRPYAAVSGAGGLKLIDDRNAVLTVDGVTLACSYEHKRGNRYVLREGGESEEPRTFDVTFDKNAASVRETDGDFSGQFAVTDNVSVPLGVWDHFAYIPAGEDELRPGSERTWVITLKDGECYSSDDVESAYRSEFAVCGDDVFLCHYDTDGRITYVDLFEYDETGAYSDRPVIRCTEPDGSYFFRLMRDDELFAYGGGTLDARAVTYECTNYAVDEEDYDLSGVPWQLRPEKDETLRLLDADVRLALQADGKAVLNVDGERAFNASVKGRWFRLPDAILVVLDKPTALTGRLFTVFAGYYRSDYLSHDESFAASALTDVTADTLYSLGYHNLRYYNKSVHTQLYWGTAWEAEDLLPKLRLDTPYTLRLTYNPGYFEAKRNDVSDYVFDGQTVTADVDMQLIFREENRLEVYREGKRYIFYYYSQSYDKNGIDILRGFDVVFDGYYLKLTNLRIGGSRVYYTRSPYFDAQFVIENS